MCRLKLKSAEIPVNKKIQLAKVREVSGKIYRLKLVFKKDILFRRGSSILKTIGACDVGTREGCTPNHPKSRHPERAKRRGEVERALRMEVRSPETFKKRETEKRGKMHEKTTSRDLETKESILKKRGEIKVGKRERGNF